MLFATVRCERANPRCAPTAITATGRPSPRPPDVFPERMTFTMLSPLDVGVFGFYMLLLVGVGVYFTRQQKGLKSYLLADQNIHWIIVAVSVLAALFSGITYLGAPAETYGHDLTYVWVLASFFIATPVTTLIFLPFFRNLNLYTAYEYLDRRFDPRVHRIVSLLYVFRICGHLGLAVYAPALAI